MLKQGLGSPNIIASLHDLGSVFRADKSTEPAAQDVNDCGVFDFRELARVGEVIARSFYCWRAGRLDRGLLLGKRPLSEFI